MGMRFEISRVFNKKNQNNWAVFDYSYSVGMLRTVDLNRNIHPVGPTRFIFYRF